MPQRITGHTGLIGILANPIKHSKSPMIHNTAFEALGLDYVYLAFDVEKENLGAAVEGLRAMQARGFNISTPYKTAIIPYLDELLPAGRMCNAVNTVVNEDGKLIGTSTDGEGFMRALREEGFDVIGKKVCMLGAGGAGTAIAMQAGLDGVGELSIFVRKGGKSLAQAEKNARILNDETACRASVHFLEDTQDLRQELSESALLINATSSGFAGQEAMCPIPDESFLHESLIVTDVIYNPPVTPLLEMAQQKGCRTMNGLGMLLYQGAAAFKLWTGKEMPIEAVKEVLR